MKTWWIGAALAAVCWSQGLGVRAQNSVPASGPLPEPAPVAPGNPAPGVSPTGGVLPGPMPGALAPQGPAGDLSLPASLPSAWGPGPLLEQFFYGHIGTQWLQRQRPGHTIFIVRDNTTAFDRGTIPLRRDTTPLQDFHDLDPHMTGGVRGTLGYLFDNSALELSGFYVPGNNAVAKARDPGRLTLFFTNAPASLVGNRGLWLQADKSVTRLRDSVGSAELDFRWWNRALTDFEGILGIRYLDLQDRLSISTDDDGLVFKDVENRPAFPARQATYGLLSHNRIVAPQLGVEGFLPIFSWASLGVLAKGAWGPNFLDVTGRVTRGDGVVELKWHRNAVIFSQIYEINAFLDILTLDRVRVRMGYNVMWAVGVNEAIDQINYDLAQPDARRRDGGSIFYHGPMFEIQMLF